MSESTLPPVDPALSDHLVELAEIARSVGARTIFVLRRTRNVGLELTGEIPVTLFVPTTIKLPQAGTILVILFPATDGGEQPIEAL